MLVVINATARRGLERTIGPYRVCGERWRRQRGAHSGHLAKQFSLLLLALGIVSVIVAACGGNDARPATTSTITPPPTSGATGTLTSAARSHDEVARLFDYDRRRPLAVTKLGSNTGRVPAEQLDDVTVQSITYASPKGGEVPALLVVPSGRGPFPGVIVQHGLPDTKEGMLPAGIDLVRTEALAILIDAPFNRPQQVASVPTRSPSPPRTGTSRSSSSSTCAGPSTCWKPGRT